MKAKEIIRDGKIPCGPASISADAVCRRRLRDQYDALLDELTKDIHPQGADEEILEMDEQVDIPEEGKEEETEEQKRERMLQEGKLKIDVKRELAAYEAETAEEPEVETEEEETEDEAKKRLIREGKMKADVKKVVQKYEDKIMPKPKTPAKPKTSDHAEPEDSEEDKDQGNSRLLQRIDGKMTRWQGKG